MLCKDDQSYNYLHVHKSHPPNTVHLLSNKIILNIFNYEIYCCVIASDNV